MRTNIEYRAASAPGSAGELRGRINYSVDSGLITERGRTFIEQVAPGAFAETLRSNSSVIVTAGHRSDDPLNVLARWPGGGLELRDTAAGLEWACKLPDTQAARDLRDLVQRSVITGASFEFSLRSGGERWSKRGDGTDLRTITDATLYEINPVASPAYAANGIEARSAQSRQTPTTPTHTDFMKAITTLRDPEARGVNLAALIGEKRSQIEIGVNDAVGRECRDMTAGTASAGGNTIASTPASLLTTLQTRSVTANLGATVYESLRDNTPLPLLSIDSGAVDPIAETGTANSVGSGFSGGVLNPKRLSVTVEVSEQLRIQNPEAFNASILSALGEALAARVDYFALNGSGTGDQPLGLLATPGVGEIVIGTDGGAPSADLIEQLEEVCGDRDFAPGFAVSAPMRRKLRRLGIWSDTAPGGPILGKRTVVSRAVRSGVTKGSATTVSPVVYGADWSRLAVGFFGVATLYVGPARANGFRSVVAGVWWDVVAREPAAFAVLRDSTTAA